MRLLTTVLSALEKTIGYLIWLVFSITVIAGLHLFGVWPYLTVAAVAGTASVWLHEAGHWLAGKAFGWRLRRFTIGPVAVEHLPEGWEFHLVPMMRGGSMVLGSVSQGPTSLEKLRLQVLIHAAGGPFASLLAAQLSVIGWLSAGNGALESRWVLPVQWSVFLFLTSLAPMRGGFLESDIVVVFRLLGGGAGANRCQARALCNLSHATGLRPRDWPADLIRARSGKPASAADRLDCYLAYIYHLDRNDSVTAAMWLHGFSEDRTKDDPPEYLLEAAWFAAFHDRDPGRARGWLEQEKRDAEPWVRERAEAAVALASGDLAGAQRLVDHALARLRSASPCGAYDFEIDRLEEIGTAIAAASPFYNDYSQSCPSSTKTSC